MGTHGTFNHNWFTYQKQKYLSLQTKVNVLKMFKLDPENKSFAEDESLRMCLDDEDEINYSQFDAAHENVFILKNLAMVEKRSIGDVNTVALSIKLDKKVESGQSKQVTL